MTDAIRTSRLVVLGWLAVAAAAFSAGATSDPAQAQSEPVHRDRPLSEWMEDLRDGERQERVNAARAIMQIGAEAEPATELLIEALDDVDRFVRQYAANALGEIGEPSGAAIPRLIEMLEDESRDIPRAASEALGGVGAAATGPLIERLSDQSAEVRFRAARALGRIGEPAVPALIEALRDDSAAVREGSARALFYMQWLPPRHRPVTAPPALIEVLSREDGPDDLRPRLWAVRALGRLEEDAAEAAEAMIELLSDEQFELHYEAVLTLARVGEPALDGLLEAMGDERARVRAGAAEALGFVRPVTQEAIGALTAALEDEDEHVRFRAADAMGALGPRFAPRLVDLMEHPSAQVRRGAVLALGKPKYNYAIREEGTGQWPPRRVHPAVVVALWEARNDEDEEVRQIAALSRRRWAAVEAARFGRPPEEEAAAPVYGVLPEGAIVPYPGFEWDLQMLEYWREGSDGARITTPQALAAAQRVFRDMPWVGMTRREVLDILGEYRRPVPSRRTADALRFRFDSGRGGSGYTLHLEEGRVSKVERNGGR